MHQQRLICVKILQFPGDATTTGPRTADQSPAVNTRRAQPPSCSALFPALQELIYVGRRHNGDGAHSWGDSARYPGAGKCDRLSTTDPFTNPRSFSPLVSTMTRLRISSFTFVERKA